MKFFNNVYIDMDSLLDTRVGVLNQLDAGVFKVLVDDGRYWTRTFDDWTMLTGGRVTTEQFQAQWEKRDTETLTHSMLTEIFGPLRNILALYTQNLIEGHVDKPLALTVNIHPYTLTDDEQEGIVSAIQYHCGHDLNVFFISTSVDDLTPKVLMEHYDAAVMYHFHDWLVIHGFAVAAAPTRDFTIMAPRLFTKDPVDLTISQKKDIFTMSELQLRYYFNMMFIASRCFSILHPHAIRDREDPPPPSDDEETPSPD